MIDWRKWDTQCVVWWIIELNPEKYHRYKSDLAKNMFDEGVDGKWLPSIGDNDLHRFGITEVMDKIHILRSIQCLVDNDGKCNDFMSKTKEDK